MQQLIAWLPQLVVTALPGFINVWISKSEWERRFRRFPIFQPFKSPRLWRLMTVEFLLPSVLFGWVSPLMFRIDPPALDRPIDVGLLGTAIAFGWGFVALLNAPISILSAGMLDIGPIYNVFVDQVYEKIASNQEPKMRRFWRELEAELQQTPNFLDRGFKDLADCLGITPTMLDESSTDLDTQTEAIIRKIQRLRKYRRQDKKAEDIVQLLQTQQSLKPQDWPELIRAFGGRETFIQRYFPKSAQKRPRS
ncbi:MAG: hypothetical protein AAGB19_21780 [Cyanobacteria bacterium P01_F01_bin.3]